MSLITVTVHGRRALDFMRVFGTTTVPVTGWLPQTAQLPGMAEPQAVLNLDLEWVAQEGYRDKLVAFLAERFEQDPAFVDRELERIGVPILARDCVVTSDARDFL